MNFQQMACATMGGILFLVSPARAVTSPQAPTVKKMKLQEKQLGDMRPVHAFGDIYLAGQPTPEDLTLLKRTGIKTIITLRKSNEITWDEAAAVKQQGMKYVAAPFQSPEELKPEVFDKVLKVLRDKKRGPTVLHCASSNRVGAIWFAYRVLDDKLSPEAALEEAKIVGLRTPDYLVQAEAYVEKVKDDRRKAENDKVKK